jgi:hypothetical protein
MNFSKMKGILAAWVGYNTAGDNVPTDIFIALVRGGLFGVVGRVECVVCNI